MCGDMGVRKRYYVDLVSQQLRQTHRKCHRRQSYTKIKKTQTQHRRKALKKTKTIRQQIKNVQQQYQPPIQQYLKKQKLLKIQSGQHQQIAPTTKHKTEKAKQRNSLNSTKTKTLKHNLKATPPHTLSRSLVFLSNLASSKHLNLKRLWVILLLSLSCLSTRGVLPVTSRNYTNRSLWLPSLASMASLALSQTALVFAAAAYEPMIKYHHSANDVEESDGMMVEDIDVNSNEQQLLAYYKKAQKEHEELKRQQQQVQEQQLHMLQQQQQRHHHQERDIKRNSVVLSEQIDFNDILPTADVISTLDNVEATLKIKSTATKRSTTKRNLPSPSPTPTSTLKPLTTTASALRTTMTTLTSTTARSEEKCEPKVLDEVPAEPVSLTHIRLR